VNPKYFVRSIFKLCDTMTDSANNSDKVSAKDDGSVSGARASVLVVGAGPTGLLLASELERRGVRCHLIDARPGPLHWDRATVVHPRSLQIFESLGLAEKFLDAGCRQRVIKIHSRGNLLGTMDLASCGSVYGFNLGVSEEVTERILTDYLETLGGKVNRSSRLTGFEPHAGGVRAEIERDGVPYHLDAQWVVGCDGLHSPTRELSGIGFEGHDIARPWAVFDATARGWADTYEGTFVYLDALPIILTALPGRRWRVYLRPSSEESDLVADAASTLQDYLPAASFIDVENPTRFHCHTKVATKFRSGRVFLAGDAAHLCSPSEGHGMNCGLQDAFNLAWKLALVHHVAADPVLLDSYEIERRPIAERVMKSGDAFEYAQTITDSAEREKRDQDIRAKLADATTLHHEVAAETELIADYCESPIVFGDANSKLAAGKRLPDTIPVQLAGMQPHKLHGIGHRAGHTLLLLAGPSAHIPTLVSLHSVLQKLTADSLLFEAAVALGSGTNLPAQIGRFEPGATDLIGLEGITLLAVRPDGYIGLRADRDHLKALERYGALIGGGSKSSPMGSAAAEFA
jgi:2-polyprenyl-6-methoxyphenol hydroxylase-like FAD-dependent oxidoreductase